MEDDEKNEIIGAFNDLLEEVYGLVQGGYLFIGDEYALSDHESLYYESIMHVWCQNSGYPMAVIRFCLNQFPLEYPEYFDGLLDIIKYEKMGGN